MKDDDGSSESPCFRIATYVWVLGITRLTNQRTHGVVLLIDQLTTLRSDLHKQIEKSVEDVEENKKTVCTLLQRGAGRRDAIILRLLKKSLALKKVRDGFVARVGTVELQIEALENSESNRNMLRTMQSTAETMRRMGLDKGLSAADSVIESLEDSMATAGDLNSALSLSVSDTYLNDDEIDSELDALMMSDFDQPNPFSAHAMVVPPQAPVRFTDIVVTKPQSVSSIPQTVLEPEGEGEALLSVIPVESGEEAGPDTDDRGVAVTV